MLSQFERDSKLHSARAAITVFVTWPCLTEYSTALIPLSLSFWLAISSDAVSDGADAVFGADYY